MHGSYRMTPRAAHETCARLIREALQRGVFNDPRTDPRTEKQMRMSLVVHSDLARQP